MCVIPVPDSTVKTFINLYKITNWRAEILACQKFGSFFYYLMVLSSKFLLRSAESFVQYAIFLKKLQYANEIVEILYFEADVIGVV